jgi:hypothetical protein
MDSGSPLNLPTDPPPPRASVKAVVDNQGTSEEDDFFGKLIS